MNLRSESAHPEADVRTLARMLGRAIAAPGGHAAKKKLILTDLARIVRADAWAWTLHAIQAPHPPLLMDFMKVGFRGKRFALYQTSIAREFSGLKEHPLVGNLNELLQCPDIGMGSAILAGASNPSRGQSTISLFRKLSAEPFSEREIAMSALILTEIPWLHEQHYPREFAPASKDLPHRLATILEMLLKGLSRKEIGDRLDIELNTVHGYVKALYSHFGVTSHSALMQYCLHDGTRSSPNP